MIVETSFIIYLACLLGATYTAFRMGWNNGVEDATLYFIKEDQKDD